MATAESAYRKPALRLAPHPTPETQAYWTGGARGELMINRCHSCDRYFHPPNPACWRCRSFDVAPEPVSGRAKVAAYTINRHPWIPGFEPPYIVALVELDDEPDVRLTTNVVDVSEDDIRIGLPVEVFFEDWPATGSDGDTVVSVPLFRPVQRQYARP